MFSLHWISHLDNFVFTSGEHFLIDFFFFKFICVKASGFLIFLFNPRFHRWEKNSLIFTHEKKILLPKLFFPLGFTQKKIKTNTT